jgi:hypothetical protein
VIRYFRVFLYSQNVKNELEEIELERIYYGLLKWLNHSGKAEFIDFKTEAVQAKAEEYYEKYQAISKNEVKLSSKFSKYVDKVMNHYDRYRRKYIIFHIALYLTSTVDNNGVIDVRHYSPICRQFLMNFLFKLIPRDKANILIKTIEKSTSNRF